MRRVALVASVVAAIGAGLALPQCGPAPSIPDASAARGHADAIAPPVVAGRFLFAPAGGSSGHRQVKFLVEVLGPGPGAGEEWRVVPDLERVQRPDGTFAVRGRTPAGRHRLSFPGYGHLPVPPVEFRPGDDSLEIPIDPGCDLDVTCQLPAGERCALRGVLRPTSGAPAAAERLPAVPADRVTVREHDPILTPGRLAWWALPSGTYVLEICMAGASQPLVTIPDVVLPQPDPRDPRLAAIDLRDRFHPLQLRVAGPAEHADGHPRETMVFPMPQADPLRWEGMAVPGGELHMLVAATPVDLLVVRDGCQPRLVRGAAREAHVVLDPWPTVELTFPGLPPLPAGVRLLVAAFPAEAEGEATPGYRRQNHSGPLDRLLHPERWVRAEDGRAAVPIRDRSYRIHAALLSVQEEGPRGLDHVEPDTFDGSRAPASIAVQLSNDEIRAVLAAMPAQTAPK